MPARGNISPQQIVDHAATPGNVPIYDASGCLVDSGNPPSGGGGGGALVLLEQHTASSSASLDFTACISSTYDTYKIVLVNVVPATTAQPLYMRMSTNGGSSYDSSSLYQYEYTNALAGTSGQAAEGSASAGQIILGAGQIDSTTDYGGVTGTMEFYNPGGSQSYKLLIGQFVIRDKRDAVISVRNQSAVYINTTATNAFQFLFASGNIASGTIRVYGIAK